MVNTVLLSHIEALEAGPPVVIGNLQNIPNVTENVMPLCGTLSPSSCRPGTAQFLSPYLQLTEQKLMIKKAGKLYKTVFCMEKKKSN